MVAQTGSHINIDFSGNLKTSINSNGIRILNPIRNATRINTIKIINSEFFASLSSSPYLLHFPHKKRGMPPQLL